MWYTYILKCNDGSLYSGITTNLENRLSRHNSGRASKYTRSRIPVVLLYTEQFSDKRQALKRELEIKDFSIDNKMKLIKYGLGQRFPSALDLNR